MDVEIRPITKNEHPDAWRVLKELRSTLSREQFETAWALQADQHDYELIGAFRNTVLLGVMGFRPVHTFARGMHLHVDDLVVTIEARDQGIGSCLIAFAEAHAAAREMKHVFLDSRPEALAFYVEHGYRQHASVLMRKDLESLLSG